MSYFYIIAVSLFVVGLVVVAATMDKEDMDERD
jgi:hypothetical protein